MLREIKLPNGSVEEFEVPTDWSDEQVASAAANYFKLTPPKTNEASAQKNESTAPQEEEYQAPKWQDIFAKALQNPEARIGMQPGVAEARETPIGQALELSASLVAPPLRMLKMGGMLGKYLPTLGKYLTTGVENAIPQAAISGGYSALSGENPLKSAGTTAAITFPLAAGAKVLGEKPISMLTDLLRMSPKSRATRNVFKGVDKSNVQPYLEAAERQGIHMTPAEASGNPFAEGTQRSIGRSPEGSQILYDASQVREKAVDKSFKDFFTNIYNPDKEGKVKKELYNQAYKDLVGPQEMAKLQEDPLFRSAVRRVQKDTAYQKRLKGVPEDNVKYLHQVSRKMDRMKNNAFDKGDRTRGDIIKETQDELKKTLNDTSTSFEKAQSIAERQIARRGLQKEFNTKDLNPENFAKLLKNDEKYLVLKNNLRNVPKAQAQLEDLKLISERLLEPDILRQASKQAANNAKTPFKMTDVWNRPTEKLLNKVWGNNYDKAAAELVTDPKWAAELKKVLRLKKRDELTKAFMSLVTKASAQTTAKD